MSNPIGTAPVFFLPPVAGAPAPAPVANGQPDAPAFAGEDAFVPEDQEMAQLKQELGLMRKVALSKKGGTTNFGYRADFGGNPLTAQTSGQGRWNLPRGLVAEGGGEAGVRMGAQGRSEGVFQLSKKGVAYDGSHAGKVAAESYAKGKLSLKGLPGGASLDGEGEATSFFGAEGQSQSKLRLDRRGLEAQSSGKARFGTELTGKAKLQANGLPFGLKAETELEGNYFSGAKSEHDAALKVDKNGVDGRLRVDAKLGTELKGSLKTKVSGLPFGSTYENTTTGRAFSGTRLEVGGFENPAIPSEGDSKDPARLKVDANGKEVIIDGGFKFFDGNEAELKTEDKLTTPIGSAKVERKVRVMEGNGMDAGYQLKSNKDEFSYGAGFGFESGASIQGEQTATLATPGGSSFAGTGVVGTGGESLEARGGMSRNNTKGQTAVAARVVVPVEGVDLGVGVQVVVDDKDVKAVGNTILPGGGDVAVKALETVPKAITETREAVVTVIQKPAEVGQAMQQNGVNDILEGQRKGGIEGAFQQTTGVVGVVGGTVMENTGNFFKQAAQGKLWPFQ